MSRGRDRVVALVDMDCFYIQVEQRLDPSLHAKPCAVVQYKTWKGGGIIAVSYEARAYGVTRNMWAADAKKLCPDLLLARVPEAHGKADLTKYREASMEVMEVMSRFAVIERASIDEAYMDLTSTVHERLRKMNGQPIAKELLATTFIQGFPNGLDVEENRDRKEEWRQHGLCQWLESLPFGDPSSPDVQLTVGAVIMEEMRTAIESATGFRCSAGIAHNKVIAKLACGLNKPNRQTLVPQDSVPQLFSKMPVGNIRSLGGKLGVSVTELLGVEYVGELIQFSESQLQMHFGDKTGSWLYDLCRGIEREPVKPRQLPKSIGCSKNFLGKAALGTQKQVQHWLLQLALELEERLKKDRDQNNRVAKQLTVVIRTHRSKHSSGLSRCCALSHYDAHKICRDAFVLIQNCNTAGGQQAAWSPPITLLQLSATKFLEAAKLSSVDITTFLTNESQCTQSTSTSASCPKKETSKKPVNPIQALFQRAAERKRAQALSGSSPSSAASERTAPSDTESLVCHEKGVNCISSQILEDPVEPHVSSSKPNSMLEEFPEDQPELSSEAGLSKAPVARGHGRMASPEAELLDVPSELPGASEEESRRSAFGLVQGAADSFAPSSVDDWIRCEKCSQRVSVWEFTEHLDYHFAVELQNSFSSPCRTPASDGSLLAKGKCKSKSQPPTSAKRPRQDATRTLDCFFKCLPP